MPSPASTPRDGAWLDEWADAFLRTPPLNPVAILADRLRRAEQALNLAPDVDPAKATRAEVERLHAANLAAWQILTEGRDPPSQREGGDV